MAAFLVSENRNIDLYSPTEISYDSSAFSDGDVTHGNSMSDRFINSTALFQSSSKSLKEVRWGFQIKPAESRIKCIKLFLDRKQKLPHFVSAVDVVGQLRKCDRDVVDAVADFLAKIHNHTTEILCKRYTEAFVKTTPVEFVLTVPAVWSDVAKNATLEAAERAGMSNLRVISEPEAAAVYTLKAIQPNKLHVGDNMVVCDAGGGTVDLISYRITQLSPLAVEESQVGTGGLCGAAFLNYRFEDHVRLRLGVTIFEEMMEKKPKAWQTALKYFEEYVKRNFDEEELEEFNVPFPGLADNEDAGMDSGFLILTAEQVKDIFAPIITEVIRLVEQQVSAIHGRGGSVSAIILVGGFGQSSYLYTRLKSHFSTQCPPPYSEHAVPAGNDSGRVVIKREDVDEKQNIDVMQPVNAWTAVVRGAVIRGLEGSIVTERRCRYHYGTTCSDHFDSNKHPLHRRYWHKLLEAYFASHCMKWYIAKNAQVSEQYAISFSFDRTFEEHEFHDNSMLTYTTRLYACSKDEALILYDAYPDIFEVCSLNIDLTKVPRHFFIPRTTSGGSSYYQLTFQLEMKIHSASLGFEMKVNGRGYGSVKASFNH